MLGASVSDALRKEIHSSIKGTRQPAVFKSDQGWGSELGSLVILFRGVAVPCLEQTVAFPCLYPGLALHNTSFTNEMGVNVEFHCSGRRRLGDG